MSRLHLYNPANDLALGLGCRNYTPPPNAASLQRAGALLPLWWAGESDCVLAPGAGTAGVSSLKALYGLNGNPVSETRGSDMRPDPWGWSADTVRIFTSAGVDPALLPSETDIAAMRMLSHRRTSISMLKEMGRVDLLPLETSDPQEAVEMERRHPGCYIKSPWSGSGRGVFCAGGLAPEILLSKAAGIIHRQGSVMVERGMKGKQADFAMLFHISGGEARYRGISMFLTENRGMYSGNIVAPQEWIFSRLAAMAGRGNLEETARSVAEALGKIAGHKYEGWAGVDMMVCQGGMIHPCIEVNLRRTMGVVAMDVASRLRPSRPGLMAWRRGAPVGLTLLPPAEGWALCLSPLE